MKIIRLSLKIFKFIIVGVLAVVVLLNMISIFKRVILKEQIPLVLGYGNAVIITGSMEPAISPGDMVIVHKQGDYKPGNIVTYKGNNSPITHRIIKKTAGGYITGGDANNTDDGEIAESRIIGRVVKTIPKAGNVILFFQSPLGILILIAGLFLMIEAPRLIERIQSDRQANRGKNV